MKMIKIDDVIEYCESDIPPLRVRGQSVAVAALRRVIAVAKEYAVDAEPVKHGEWKINSDGYYPYCSVCGTAADQLTKHLTKYCPECGARMDGDAE